MPGVCAPKVCNSEPDKVFDRQEKPKGKPQNAHTILQAANCAI